MLSVYVPKNEKGPRVFSDARSDSYDEDKRHHIYRYEPGRVVPIYIRLFPRSAYIGAIYRAGASGPRVSMLYTEGTGSRLLLVQGRPPVFKLRDLIGDIRNIDELDLEAISERFWAYTQLQIIRYDYQSFYRWHVPGYRCAA